MGDGGEPTAVRIGYSPQAEIPALLEAIGVYPVSASERFSLSARAPTAPVQGPIFGRIIASPPEDEDDEEVIDLGVIELDMDFDFDEDHPSTHQPEPVGRRTGSPLDLGL